MTGAIGRAAQSTGANFDYLLTTAKVESNLDSNSTKSTSTATGFLDQSWLVTFTFIWSHETLSVIAREQLPREVSPC